MNRFDIYSVLFDRVEYQWVMVTNNGMFLAESRFYGKKSDCLRAIEKHFNCKIVKCGPRFKKARAFREGIKLFAEIIDQTK